MAEEQVTDTVETPIETEVESFDSDTTVSEKDSSFDDLSWDDIEDVSVEAQDEGKSESESEGTTTKSENSNTDSSENKESTEETKEISKPEDNTEASNKDDVAKLLETGELKVKAKVDGEEVEVSIQELKNNYAGKVAWDKKFSEIDRKEKSFKADVDAINNYINDFGQKMKAKDAVGALQYLGSFANMPSYKIKEMLIEQLTPEIIRRAELSELEINKEYTDAENEYLKSLHESNQRKLEQEQATMELNAKVTKEREIHSITEEEWSSTESFIKSENPSLTITPELISEVVVHERAYLRAGSILDKVDPELKKDENFLIELKELVLSHKEDSDEHFIKVVREAAGLTDSVEKELAQKIQKKENAQTKKTQSKQEKAQEEIAPVLDWEELF